MRPLLDGNGELRPILHLHTRHQLILATLRFEDRRFAFLHIEPLPPQGVDNVGLVRDKDAVFALFGRMRQHLAKGRGSPAIFVRRHNETALRQIDSLLNVFKSRQDRGLISSIEVACVDFTNGDTKLVDCIAKLFGQLLTLLVEVPLPGDVIEIERVGIGLIREGRAMSNKNDVSA